MWLSKIASVTERVFNPIFSASLILSMVVLLLMVLYVTADVFLRAAFNAPIKGTVEGVGQLMTVAFVYGAAQMQRMKGHVAMDMLVRRFSERTQLVVKRFVYFIYFIFIAVLTWRAFLQADFLRERGKLTYGHVWPFEYIPEFPGFYAVAVGVALFAMAVLIDLLNSLARRPEK